jgi:hypothetical protein
LRQFPHGLGLAETVMKFRPITPTPRLARFRAPSKLAKVQLRTCQRPS